jgi:high mobility group protein B4
MKQNFSRIKMENPAFSVPEVARALAVAWRNTMPGDKEELKRLCALDRERWVREKAEWEKTQPPKRPKSAFLLFCDEHRAQVVRNLPAGAGVAEAAKVMGGMWRILPEQEKRRFADDAAKLKAEWEVKMEQFD